MFVKQHLLPERHGDADSLAPTVLIDSYFCKLLVEQRKVIEIYRVLAEIRKGKGRAFGALKSSSVIE